MATYTCYSGFTLVGNMERLCQNDGTWSGTDPTCEGTLRKAFAYVLTFGLAPAHFCIPLIYLYIRFGGISGQGEHQWAVSEPTSQQLAKLSGPVLANAASGMLLPWLREPPFP